MSPAVHYKAIFPTTNWAVYSSSPRKVAILTMNIFLVRCSRALNEWRGNIFDYSDGLFVRTWTIVCDPARYALPPSVADSGAVVFFVAHKSRRFVFSARPVIHQRPPNTAIYSPARHRSAKVSQSLNPLGAIFISLDEAPYPALAHPTVSGRNVPVRENSYLKHIL